MGGWADVPRFERAVRCVLRLQAGLAVNVPWMMRELGVSHAQATRDMLELERVMPVVRSDGKLTLLQSNWRKHEIDSRPGLPVHQFGEH